MRTYTVTYDIVSPESAEHGDYSDSGYGIPGSLCQTSMALVDRHPHGSDAWLREYDAARLAATDTVVPDDYDLDVALDTLTLRDMPEGDACPECDRVVSHAVSCSLRTAADPTPEAVESAAAVALVVKVLHDAGATEPSCGGYDGPGTGYTQVDGSTDYRTGEETRLSYHLEGWSDDEARAIYAAITGR